MSLLGVGHLRGVSWGQGQVVGAGQPETVGISHVGNGLGQASGIHVAVGAGHIAVLVSGLLLGGIDVAVAIFHTAELILIIIIFS